MLGVLFRFLVSFVTTLSRRLVHGPAWPGWSFSFEVSVAFLRSTSAAAAGRPPLEQRAVWGALPAPHSAHTRRMRLRPETLAGVACQWIEPPTVSREGVVVYLHGGGFVFGGISSCLDLMSQIALEAEMRVLYVEYRLVPEHPWPAAVEDVAAVCEALAGRAEGPVVLAGDSAGGNLVLAAGLTLHERGGPLPAGLVAISPWVDLTCFDGSMTRHEGIDWGIASDFPNLAAAYAGTHDRTLPTISPAFADLSVLPPTLLMYGSNEMLYDQDTALAERAAAQGAPVEVEVFDGMVHGWVSLGDQTPQGPAALDRIRRFVQRLHVLALTRSCHAQR